LSFYLDASVLVALRVQEPSTEHVLAFLEQNLKPVWVGDFAAGEFVSAIGRLVRMERIGAVSGAERLADFDRWRAADSRPLHTEAPDIRLAAEFVRRFDLGLRMSDAIHLAVCSRHGLTLVTLDRALADVSPSLGVAVERPA
jgi:uncharacterized protein